MTVVKLQVYMGPNVVAPFAVVHVSLAVKGPQNWPGDAPGRACGDQLFIIDSDKAAVDKGLDLAKAGDLLFVMFDDKDWLWERIVRYDPHKGRD